MRRLDHEPPHRRLRNSVVFAKALFPQQRCFRSRAAKKVNGSADTPGSVGRLRDRDGHLSRDYVAAAL